MQDGMQIDILFDPVSYRNFQNLKEAMHADSDTEVGRRAILASQFFTPTTPSKRAADHNGDDKVVPLGSKKIVTFYLTQEVFEIMERERKSEEEEVPPEVYIVDSLRILAMIHRQQIAVLEKIHAGVRPEGEELTAMFMMP